MVAVVAVVGPYLLVPPTLPLPTSEGERALPLIGGGLLLGGATAGPHELKDDKDCAAAAALGGAGASRGVATAVLLLLLARKGVGRERGAELGTTMFTTLAPASPPEAVGADSKFVAEAVKLRSAPPLPRGGGRVCGTGEATSQRMNDEEPLRDRARDGDIEDEEGTAVAVAAGGSGGGRAAEAIRLLVVEGDAAFDDKLFVLVLLLSKGVGVVGPLSDVFCMLCRSAAE